MMNSCNRERENRDRIIELSIEISEEHERGKISGNWSGWKIGQVTEIGWKWWLAAADKYEWPTRYIYIHIHIRVYTNRSRYINYVACSIKIDLRLIGNARAHATRFLACSVSTDFQPRYYRVQFRNEHLANERATRTTRIEADNRAMNALTRTKPVPTINYCPPRFYDYFYDTIVVIKSFWFVEEERVDNMEESLRSEFRFEFRSRKDSISIFLDNRSSRIFEEYFFLNGFV